MNQKLSLIVNLLILFATEKAIAVEKPEAVPNRQITFTENKGQVSDQHHKPRPDILFGGDANGLVFHLRTNGVSYQLQKVDKWKEIEDPKTNTKQKLAEQTTIYRLDLTWLNANNYYSIVTEKAYDGFSNYYSEVCPKGTQNVKSYSSIWYKNLYDQIDLHYYEKNNALKYDYIVAPGGDYKKIRIKIDGSQGISVQKDGSLLLKTPLGDISEEAPIVYQASKRLEAKWLLTDNILSFDIENYNPKLELVIDPVTRLWGTYYGGTGLEYARGGNSDSNGNLFFAGYTSTSTGTAIATVGSHQSTYTGGFYDAFITKLSATGTRLWSTYYGGSGNEFGNACSSDNSGNVYFVGFTDSGTSTLIATPASHQSTYGGGFYDAFLVKLNSNGVRQWGTYYGGTGDDYGMYVHAEATGNLYIAGFTSTGTGSAIATVGAHQYNYDASTDAFLIKFNSNGQRIWGTYYGGASIDYGYGCTTDNSGNVFLIGRTASSNSTVIATAGSHQATLPSGPFYDAFVVKFNSSGVRQWGTYYGGTGDEVGNTVSTDASANVYITGTTDTNTGTVIATVGSHQATYGGGATDGFIAKFNSGGVRQWGTYYGGAGDDQANAMCVDFAGNPYVVGATSLSTGTTIASAGSYQSTSGGIYDGFLTKFSTTGIRQWGSYYGATGNDYLQSCALDGIGNLYIIGTTASPTSTMIASPGSHQTSYGGSSNDALIAKITDCIALSPSATCTSFICEGSAINFSTTLSGTATATFSWTGPNAFSSSVQNPTIVSASNLNIGTYTVRVNNGGCIETASVVLGIVNPQPNILLTNSTICRGSSYTIVPSGASSYTIQGGTAVVSPTSTTIYTVIGTSSLGCVSIQAASVTVFVNSNPTITVNSGTICSGASFTLLPAGANTYTIQGGNTIVSPTANVSYTVAGTSSQGCTSAAPATCVIVVNPRPNITVNSGAICLGSSFTISPAGAASYTIQGANAIVSPTANATYTLTGTSALGCQSTSFATSNVTVNPNPTITVNSGTICSGISFTLTPNGANTYTYQGGSNVVSPNSSTSYTVRGTSGAGCVSTGFATSSITVKNSPTISVNSGSICIGSSFTISPSGASTYTVLGGSFVVSPTANSGYTVIGTGANGCVSQQFATSNITVILNPTISVNSGSICFGNSYTIQPSGATNYTIQGGSAVVSPTATTSYSVLGSNSFGCFDPTPAYCSIQVNPNPTISVNSGTICQGQTFTIVPTGANTYFIQGNNNLVNPISNTSYTVAGTSIEGCTSTTFATCFVTVKQSPTITVASTKTLACAGEPVVLSAIGAINYTYTPGGTGASLSITPLITATYAVSGSSSNGCIGTTSFVQTVDNCSQLNKNSLSSAGAMHIYPNPTADHIVLEWSGSTPSTIKIELLNTIGQLLLTEITTDTTIVFNLQYLSAGAYFIRTTADTEVTFHKIIKE